MVIGFFAGIILTIGYFNFKSIYELYLEENKCEHKPDFNNFKKAVCVKCGKDIPHIVYTETSIGVNEILVSSGWWGKRAIKKFIDKD